MKELEATEKDLRRRTRIQRAALVAAVVALFAAAAILILSCSR